LNKQRHITRMRFENEIQRINFDRFAQSDLYIIESPVTLQS